jgi:hypothetical protein
VETKQGLNIKKVWTTCAAREMDGPDMDSSVLCCVLFYDEWGKKLVKPQLKTGFFYKGKYTVNLLLP